MILKRRADTSEEVGLVGCFFYIFLVGFFYYLKHMCSSSSPLTYNFELN